MLSTNKMMIAFSETNIHNNNNTVILSENSPWISGMVFLKKNYNIMYTQNLSASV